MSKTIVKELRDDCFLKIKQCLNKKCKIVKEIEPGRVYDAKLIAIDPTYKNRLLFQLEDSDFDKLLIEEGIFIYIGK